VRRLVAVLAAVLLLAPAAAATGAVHVPARDRAQITKVLNAYVAAGIERHDLRRAYQLSGPDMRSGMTFRQWLHGGITAYPYQTSDSDFSGWVADYREPREVDLSLVLHPAKTEKQPQTVFEVRMAKIGGRWLVNAFIPAATEGRTIFAKNDLLPGRNGQADARLSRLWLILPTVLVLGLMVVVPAGLLVRGRVRDRRALQEYLTTRRQV
jgi:hypothetical protein